jgi:hypothetical protein
MLQQLVARLRLADVRFFSHVTNEQPRRSRHRRLFPAPASTGVLRAPRRGLSGAPVIACGHGVPATLDGAGVLYDTKDPLHVAALIDAIVSDTRLQESILDGQDRALVRLRGRDFAGTLLRFVDGVAASPARPHPGVAFDFWDQYQQYERLEELRQYRPSFGLALPPPPGDPAPARDR